MPNLQLAGLTVHVNTSATTKTNAMNGAVVLLHGFGAPGTDLVSLGDILSVPKGVGLFFPEGPLDLSSHFGTGYAGSRAWWPIDMVQLQVAMMSGQVQNAARSLARGLEQARKQVLALLDDLCSSFGIQSERVVLGGFSQGAVACLDAVLNDSRRFAGLLLMSGTMVNPESVAALARLRPGTRALISHGASDPVLPYAIAEALRNELDSAGWELTWVPFAGGHGITSEVIRATASVLPEWLK